LSEINHVKLFKSWLAGLTFCETYLTECCEKGNKIHKNKERKPQMEKEEKYPYLYKTKLLK